MTEAYPLAWPSGRLRRAPGQRKTGKFSSQRASVEYRTSRPLSIAVALERLQSELYKIGARYAVVSSNLERRLDGLPRSGQKEPSDPGVAVYFHLGGKPHCFPCDTYQLVAHNIAAIAAHIEATRAIERHGVASVAEMFSGFVALPAPNRGWREILGVSQNASPEDIDRAYRIKAKELHPDNGGDRSAWDELQRAITEARKG